jgi:TetR/AcrR family transcriptional regulator
VQRTRTSPAAAGGNEATTGRKRGRAVQQRARDTQRRIIEAATEEFAALGYQGASTRSIAARARVQHTLLTYHFRGKEGLWRQTIASMATNYKREFDARLQGLSELDDVAKLRLLHEDFIRSAARDPTFHRILSHISRTPNPQLDWLVEQYLRHPVEDWTRLIRSAQKAGSYIQGDPHQLKYLFVGAATHVFLLAAEVEKVIGRSPSEPEFVEQYVRLCLSLFFRDPPAAAPERPERRAAPKSARRRRALS